MENFHIGARALMVNITGFIGSFLVDFPQLLCGEEDIKEMGIPMGPRKKLIGYLNSQKSIMVSFTLQ